MSDFDGVIFHISTPETKTKILVSLQIRCFSDLARYGAEQVLKREYGPLVVPPEPGYDFSILVDLENLPADKGLYLPRAYVCMVLSMLTCDLRRGARCARE